MQIPLFSKKSESLLGIDVGSSSLKIVELSRSGRNVSVQNAGIYPIAPNTIVEGKITDIPMLAQTLRKAVALMRTKAKNVALAVPGSAVITRVLEMPADLTEDELETQLLMEAEQYIPYSLDEVAVDFTVIENSGEDSEQVKVLLAACRKETIDALTDSVEQADLESKIVDVEPFCLERVYPLLADQLEEDNEGLIAVVDCGATSLRINELDQVSTVYSREESFGTKQLSEEIQRRSGLSQEQALTAERDNDLAGDYEKEVLSPFRDSLIQQIAPSLQFFYSSTSYSHLDCLILSGGIASNAELPSMTESKIEVPVIAANPFKHMSHSDRISTKQLTNISPSLLIATGLALRGIN